MKAKSFTERHFLYADIYPGKDALASMRLLARSLCRYDGMQVKVVYTWAWQIVADPGPSGEFTRWEKDKIDTYAVNMPVMIEWFHRGRQAEQNAELRRKYTADAPVKKRRTR